MITLDEMIRIIKQAQTLTEYQSATSYLREFNEQPKTNLFQRLVANYHIEQKRKQILDMEV